MVRSFRLSPLLTTSLVVAAALITAPVSGLVDRASAATPAMTVTGGWTLDKADGGLIQLMLHVHGAASGPLVVASTPFGAFHNAAYSVFALPPSMPCPTTTPDTSDPLSQYDVFDYLPDAATGDFAYDGAASFPEGYSGPGLSDPMHLCGLLDETWSNAPALVTTADSGPIAPPVLRPQLTVSWSEAKVFGSGTVMWPDGSLSLPIGQEHVQGGLVERVSATVQHKLGLASPVLGYAKIDAPGPMFRTTLVTTKKALNAMYHWGGEAATMTVKFTSPVQMTRTVTFHSQLARQNVYSWKSGTSGGDGA